MPLHNILSMFCLCFLVENCQIIKIFYKKTLYSGDKREERRYMYDLSMVLVPGILCLAGGYALYRGTEVFPVFVRGAKKGLKTAVTIFPTMLGLLTAIYMLRASGAIDILGSALSPVLTLFGIPEECSALVLLKPMSGGGGLALGSEIMKTFGVDSYPGRVAAVMLGASETSIYTISIYAGYLKLDKLRYALPAALLGDMTAFIASAFFVKLLFYGA